MGFDLGDMMKKVQQLQGDMTKLQDELAHKTVRATVGGGMVTVEINGKMELVSLNIEREVIDPNDPEMLSDLLKAALNEGIRRAQELALEETRKLAGGIAGLPEFLMGGH